MTVEWPEALAAIVGKANVRTSAADVAAYSRDWRGRYEGLPRCVVLPKSAEEVADVVRLCQARRIPVVPQAGNTGLTGGAVALGHAEAVILNVSRLNAIREVDAVNNSITVEAGCILADVRRVADNHGRLFPMLLGSVGSCEIGGLVSTNAGGTGVLRYGAMRELTLGLEVVLPDGRIWNGLRALRKDNAGYDLKQLFIGAEGTLGVVTAAVLKLHPRLRASATAMAALDSVEDVVALLQAIQNGVGNRIEAFEVLSRSQLEIVLKQLPELRSPLGTQSLWYALVEIADSADGGDPADLLERSLGAAMEAGLVADAVVASDLAKAARIWDLRHHISEANKRAGFTVSNDTSVPISRIAEFIARVEARLAEATPGAMICHAGHVGDGNIHVIAVLPRDRYSDVETCEAGADIVNAIVHEESVALNGSISAEHGVGLMHVERLHRFKPALDIDMMRTLKAAFDPLGLMNPGKVVSR